MGTSVIDYAYKKSEVQNLVVRKERQLCDHWVKNPCFIDEAI
jgi:hypothetical protein